MSAIGFECDSISSLNTKASENRLCCEEGVGKTGATSRGTLLYVKKHKPRFLALENVKNLLAKDKHDAKGRSNLTILLGTLNENGYLVYWHVQNCMLYGSS